MSNPKDSIAYRLEVIKAKINVLIMAAGSYQEQMNNLSEIQSFCELHKQEIFSEILKAAQLK